MVEYTLFSETLPDGKHPVWVYYVTHSIILRVTMPSLDLCTVIEGTNASGVLDTRNYDVIHKGSKEWKLAEDIFKTAFDRDLLVNDKPVICR